MLPSLLGPFLGPALAAGVCGLAVAQRVVVPDDGGRILQLFDLRRLLDDEWTRPAAPTPGDAARTAELLRPFVEPTLGAGDDLRALGDRWIAVLADAERIACVERMFAAARTRRGDLIDVEVRLLSVPAAAFREHLRDRFVAADAGGAGTLTAVVPAADAAGFLEAAKAANGQGLAAPRVLVRPLQRAEVSLVQETSYVEDFEVERVADRTIVTPVVAVVWDGMRFEVAATFLPDDAIGLWCDVELRELQRPIQEVQTTVAPGQPPVAIQLPRTSGVRLQHTARTPDGALLGLAGRRPDGAYLVAIVGASAAARAPAAAPRIR